LCHIRTEWEQRYRRKDTWRGRMRKERERKGHSIGKGEGTGKIRLG